MVWHMLWLAALCLGLPCLRGARTPLCRAQEVLGGARVVAVGRKAGPCESIPAPGAPPLLEHPCTVRHSGGAAAGWTLAAELPGSVGKGANLLGLPPGPCHSPGKAWSLPVLSSLPAGAAPATTAPGPVGLLQCKPCRGMCVQPLGLSGFAAVLRVPAVSPLGRDRRDEGSSWAMCSHASVSPPVGWGLRLPIGPCVMRVLCPAFAGSDFYGCPCESLHAHSKTAGRRAGSAPLLLPNPTVALTAVAQWSAGQLQGLEQSLCGWAGGSPWGRRGIGRV